MTNQDGARFSTLMVALGLAFGGEVSKAKISVFWEALSNLDIEAVEYAAKEACKNEQRFPVPAKLREYAGCYRRPMIADLSRKAIPEDCTPPEVARKRLNEIFEKFNANFGTDLKAV